MAKLWENRRNDNGKSHLHEIDLPKLAISSPTVIYLTGYMTTDARPHYVAANLRNIKNLLRSTAEIPSAPQVYVWSYSNLRNVFNLAAYNFRPGHFCSSSAKKLAEGAIMPLVSENGKPLPRDEAQKRLRNLTFFGYSAGSIVAQEVFNASLKMMQKSGYKPEDARALLREVVLVSAGNVSRQGKEHNRFTTLYLAASNDGVICWKDRLWSPRHSLFARQAKELTIRPLSDTSLLITAPIKKEKTSPHALSHFVSRSDDEHEPFSRIVFYALMNAVKRQETPDAARLLEPPPSLTPQEKAAWRDRISNAIIKK